MASHARLAVLMTLYHGTDVLLNPGNQGEQTGSVFKKELEAAIDVTCLSSYPCRKYTQILSFCNKWSVGKSNEGIRKRYMRVHDGGLRFDLYGLLYKGRSTCCSSSNPPPPTLNAGSARHWYDSQQELAAVNYTKASLKDENDPRQVQLVNTSAYYTYLLLVIKSMVYTIIIAICLLGRSALCDNGKSS